MSTATILINTVLGNWVPIFSTFACMLLVLAVGVCLFKTFVEEKNYLIVLPAGFIIGVYTLIFYLAVLSYIFKGISGIYIIYFLYLATGVILFRKTIKWSVGNLKLNFNFATVFQSIIVLFFLSFFFVIAGNNIYGGDVITYWGFANTFVNGNYPISSPWQPDLLANHHQGVFLFQGVVSALAGADIQLVHSLFSWAIASAGFFLIWGWVQKNTGSRFFSILPSLVTIVAFGLIVFFIPNVFKSFIQPEVDREFVLKPVILTDFKNTLGGSSNLNEVYYINHRISSIVGLILILMLISSRFKASRRVKILAVAILAIGVISTDEVVLPGLIIAGLIWFVLSVYGKHPFAKKILEDKVFISNDSKGRILSDFLIGAIFFVIIFFVVGSALRDSMLTPPQELPRFQFTTSLQGLLGRWNWLKGAFLTDHNLPVSLYFPSALFLIVLSVGLLFVKRSFFQLLLMGSVLGTLIAYFTIDHTYYPGNYGRFQHLFYILSGLLISYSAISLLKSNSKRTFIKIGALCVILLYIPGILSTSYYLGAKAKDSSYPNFEIRKTEIPSLDWLRRYHPAKRIFISDGTFIGRADKNLINIAIQRYGLMVPLSPVYFKVHTPDWGPEALDLIYTLNPKDLMELKIEYLLVTNDQFAYYNLIRREELKNTEFLTQVYRDDFATIYKVKSAYLTEGKDLSPNLRQLPQLLDVSNKNIYLDYPPRMDFSVRAVLMLVLKKSKNLYSEWRSGGFNYIETQIKITPPSKDDKYDYIIISPNTEPLSVCNCKVVKRTIWSINKAVVYEVID